MGRTQWGHILPAGCVRTPRVVLTCNSPLPLLALANCSGRRCLSPTVGSVGRRPSLHKTLKNPYVETLACHVYNIGKPLRKNIWNTKYKTFKNPYVKTLENPYKKTSENPYVKNIRKSLYVSK